MTRPRRSQRRQPSSDSSKTIVIIALLAVIAGALLVLVLGMAFPYVLRRIFHLATKAMHAALLFIAALALILHAVIDGIALLPGNGEELGVAVILHRLPVGMAIWWTFRPAIGTKAAVAAFVLIISATALAFYFGGPVIELAESKMLALFQLFVAGSLADMVIVGLRDLFRKAPQRSD